MYKVDLVGIGIVKNYPTPTGGPGGGALCPPPPLACGIQSWQDVRPVSTEDV